MTALIKFHSKMRMLPLNNVDELSFFHKMSIVYYDKRWRDSFALFNENHAILWTI